MIRRTTRSKRTNTHCTRTMLCGDDPNNVDEFNWLGILNREAGNYERARLAYEKGLQVATGDTMTRLNYAILLDQYLKQPQAALGQYKLYQSASDKEDLPCTAWVAASA